MVNADHVPVTLDNVSDTLEIIFDENGTDVVTAPNQKQYLGLTKQFVGAVHITADQIWQITEINNVVLKGPKSFPANGAFQQNVSPYQKLKFHQIKVKCLVTGTSFSVYGSN